MNTIVLGYSNGETAVLSILGIILLMLLYLMIKRVEKGPPTTDIGRILFFSFFFVGIGSIGVFCQLPALLWLFAVIA